MSKVLPQYADYSDMLHHLVWQWASNGAADHDTLMSVAHTAFMDARSSYDFHKGSFSHWLYIVVNNRLNDFVEKWSRTIPSDTETVLLSDVIPSHYGEWEPRRRACFRDRLRRLSDEAQYVAGIVLNAPAEMLGIKKCRTPRGVRGAMTQHLRRKEWSWPRIWRTYDELKEFCR